MTDAPRQEVNQSQGSAGGGSRKITAAAVISDPLGHPHLTLWLPHLQQGTAGRDKPGPRVPASFV